MGPFDVVGRHPTQPSITPLVTPGVEDPEVQLPAECLPPDDEHGMITGDGIGRRWLAEQDLTRRGQERLAHPSSESYIVTCHDRGLDGAGAILSGLINTNVLSRPSRMSLAHGGPVGATVDSDPELAPLPKLLGRCAELPQRDGQGAEVCAGVEPLTPVFLAAVPVREQAARLIEWQPVPGLLQDDRMHECVRHTGRGVLLIEDEPLPIDYGYVWFVTKRFGYAMELEPHRFEAVRRQCASLELET